MYDYESQQDVLQDEHEAYTERPDLEVEALRNWEE